MISIRTALVSAVSPLKRFAFVVLVFIRGKLASARDRRLFSRMNQRELRELGLIRDKDSGSYHHLP